MQPEAEFGKPRPLKPAFHDIQRRLLLGDNSTVLSVARTLAMMFAMVCDLPVPGGP